MKKILLILILIVFGCKDKEETEFLESQEKIKKEYDKAHSLTDVLLDFDGEKLALLSIIKNTPNDTLRLVLKEYLKKTFPLVTDASKVDKIIDTISQKYHISKIKVASIVFSYNYEMLTKDEIEQSAIENEEVNKK
ncbi:hypothetical protein [Flavobacterium urumqiense]|uniref:Lipoprotein n=1 Tax=Flavobacterium urumqiense TaxID=935224 RepID=A0A1H5SH34_9FLAO|nr:hypothetical protein [Flavobacterium urumqiense]SEF49785.1 hypothetical protein SAMN04488130_101280 [Flavobacterium urumqiense]